MSFISLFPYIFKLSIVRMYRLCNKKSGVIFCYLKCLLNAIGQVLASFFHEEPDSKYFRFLSQMVSVTTVPLCCLAQK